MVIIFFFVIVGLAEQFLKAGHPYGAFALLVLFGVFCLIKSYLDNESA